MANLSAIVWLVIAAISIIAVYLGYKYLSKIFSTSESQTEANPHVDEKASQDALIQMSLENATPEQQAAALQTYFNTAHDPNPQGFFSRLWSIF